MKEEESIGMEILPQQKIEKKVPGRERQGWVPSRWNKKYTPREKPAPIMMCRRCKHPR